MREFKCGLEIHVYLKVKNQKKLFCDCSLIESDPNTNICPICTAMPGSKPQMPNSEAIANGLKVALMLGCKINQNLIFQRKHYSWPDLPSGYQRTMSGSYALPLGEHGKFLGIGITGVHLEEDPARWNPKTGEVDYNRSGTPLAEVVTDPDFRSKQQVRDWLFGFISTLRYVDAIDPKIGVKADLNVSIAPAFGRVEIKNINSFKAITQALEYEIARQASEVDAGNTIKLETRMWDEQKTVFMRNKETADDYMYIPEPDLNPIHISDKEIHDTKHSLPESPEIKAHKFESLGVNLDDSLIISSDPILANILEKIIPIADSKIAGSFIRRDVLSVLEDDELSNVDVKQLATLIIMLAQKKITDKTAKQILFMLKDGINVEKYVSENNLLAVSDENELIIFAKEAISENLKAIEDYKAGKAEALNFLVGQVIKKTKGKAQATIVREIFSKLIN